MGSQLPSLPVNRVTEPLQLYGVRLTHGLHLPSDVHQRLAAVAVLQLLQRRPLTQGR